MKKYPITEALLMMQEDEIKFMLAEEILTINQEEMLGKLLKVIDYTRNQTKESSKEIKEKQMKVTFELVEHNFFKTFGYPMYVVKQKEEIEDEVDKYGECAIYLETKESILAVSERGIEYWEDDEYKKPTIEEIKKSKAIEILVESMERLAKEPLKKIKQEDISINLEKTKEEENELEMEEYIEEEQEETIKMLFYQPIIDEMKEEYSKTNKAKQKARKLGLKIEIKPLNYIVQGESGLGKTTLTDEIHETVKRGKNKKRVTTAEMMSKYVGESAETVRKIVKEVSDGTLIVTGFDSWENHKSDTGSDHALEPMKELVSLAKTKDFTLVFEGTNKEIQGIFSKMPEMKDLFYKTIDLASYQLEHLIELTEFKLQQNKITIDEEAKEELLKYYKNNKATNGHFVVKTVQQIVINILTKDKEMKVTKEQIEELTELTSEPKQSETKYSYKEANLELASLVGQENVKRKIKSILNLAIVQEKRKQKGKKEIKTTRHMIFSGSPGTGKTTVARIVGKLYAASGLISKGHFVEATIDQLTNAANVTENINRLVDKAKGGVLFIDEAYALLKTQKGREALDALIPLLENRREEFVCILAGYSEDMMQLKQANVGLESRTKEVTFEDYNSDELYKILYDLTLKNDYLLEEDAEKYLKEFVQQNKFKGNGRGMRNLFDSIIEIQANRIVEEESEEYEVITKKDIFELSSSKKEVELV